MARVIPAAHSAFNGERPRSFARPEATLVSYAAGADPSTLAAEAERLIDRLLLALHLLYGSTASGIYQVTSETTSVRQYTAQMDVLPTTRFPWLSDLPWCRGLPSSQSRNSSRCMTARNTAAQGR